MVSDLTSGEVLEEYLNKYKNPTVLVVGPNVGCMDDPAVLFVSNWIKRNGQGELIVAESQTLRVLTKVAKEGYAGSGTIELYEDSFEDLMKMASNSFIFPDLQLITDAAELPFNKSVNILIDHCTWHWALRSSMVFPKGSGIPHDVEYRHTPAADKRGARILTTYLNALEKGGVVMFFYDSKRFGKNCKFASMAEEVLQKYLMRSRNKKLFIIDDKYEIQFANKKELQAVKEEDSDYVLKTDEKNAAIIKPKYECERLAVIKKV